MADNGSARVKLSDVKPNAFSTSALILAILVAYRLLAVSNYEPATALAVAKAQGASATALGTLIPLLPPFLPLAVTIFALLAILFALYSDYTPAINALLLAVGLLLAAALISDPGAASVGGLLMDALLSGTGIIAILTIVLWAVFGNPDLDRFALVLLAAVTLAIASAFPGSATSPDFSMTREMWLPPETLTRRDGRIEIGYVLDQNREWTTVLTDSTRTVRIISTPEIVARAVCLRTEPVPPPLWRDKDARIAPPARCPSS
jgi:hypothetical protein